MHQRRQSHNALNIILKRNLRRPGRCELLHHREVHERTAATNGIAAQGNLGGGGEVMVEGRVPSPLLWVIE